MTVPRPSAEFEPHLVLLLYGDPSDAVTRALVEGRSQLGWPLLAVSTQELLDGTELDDNWTVAGRRVTPQHTAVINRLPLGDRLEPGPETAAGTVARQALWSRLHDELGRFGYASSLPTASSILGCYGSLLDQWQDLPRKWPSQRPCSSHWWAEPQRRSTLPVQQVTAWSLNCGAGRKERQPSNPLT